MLFQLNQIDDSLAISIILFHVNKWHDDMDITVVE